MSVELETIEQELRAGGSPGPIQKVRYTHKAMADLIIANPAISQNELADHFGYSASWVSTILASDAFQSYLAERQEELVDPSIRATIEERFKALAMRSMEILQEKLKGPVHTIPNNLVLRSLELSTKAAGFGARVELPAPAPQNGDHLTILADRLVVLQRNHRGIIDGQIQAIQEQKALSKGPAPAGGTEGSN